MKWIVGAQMRTRLFGACMVSAACLMVLVTTSSAVAQVRPLHAWGPSNLDTTANGNFRGARITSRAQLDSMKRVLGITTVINLAKDALPRKGESEIDWCRDLGLTYVSVYLGSKPPKQEDWERIRAALDEGKAYVHCAHGADRTGAIIAQYRVEREGMSSEAAYREARRYGFKPWLRDLRAWFGHP